MNLLLDTIVDPATTAQRSAASTAGHLFCFTDQYIRVEMPTFQSTGGGSWRYIASQH